MDVSDMLEQYLESISLIERLHRQFLDVVKAELDASGIRDISNVQALILFNVGGEEVTVGELTQRGYYLGSNVSYNLKKMVENGYLTQERSAHDRRSVRVRLSRKGAALWPQLNEMFQRHAAALDAVQEPGKGLPAAIETLRTLEAFWRDVNPAASVGLKPPAPVPVNERGGPRRSAPRRPGRTSNAVAAG